MLMIANFSSNFIVGSAKFAIQIIWSAIVFAQISFSFSITNLFLTFVMAISAVLFPSLKRMDKSRLPIFYSAIRGLITPVLICALAFYFPGSYILKIWLPKYEDSLIYAGILLPLIISSTKVSLLTNNYLKAFREEKNVNHKCYEHAHRASTACVFLCIVQKFGRNTNINCSRVFS
ncbi:hypothetical protein SUT503_14400 [Streptococcus parasuis]|nr:hypothetical protein SUT503_14400 [Streptococcus parasuis]